MPSNSHEWRKITRVSPSDMTQLCAYWITRQTLPRPVRRRAVEAGILHPGTPALFTHEGTVWMLEHAPRSPWSPATPPEQRQERGLGLRAALATAVLIGAGPYE